MVRTALWTHELSGLVVFVFLPGPAHATLGARGAVVVKGGADIERVWAGMWLYVCARDVLEAAMRLLSIRAFERM
jgi:hypothetical protein